MSWATRWKQIAREKLAVASEGAIVVLPDDTYAALVAGHEIRIGGAREAAETFVGHPIDAAPEVSLPGRLEQREGEVRDGAHNPDGVRYLVERLPSGDHAIVASILADKDADAMLRELRRAGSRFVATRSSSPRALPAETSPTSRVATSPTWTPSTTPAKLWRGRTSSGGPCS